jgi:hypothetical protein
MRLHPLTGLGGRGAGLVGIACEVTRQGSDGRGG